MRRIGEMLKAGTRSGRLPAMADFQRELEASRRTIARAVDGHWGKIAEAAPAGYAEILDKIGDRFGALHEAPARIESDAWTVLSDAVAAGRVTAARYRRFDGADHSNQGKIVLSGHRIDLANILATKPQKKIVIEGYFERYEYYRAHKDAIRREWLRTDPGDIPPTDPDAVVVHVRRRDKLSSGDALPFSFYERAIEEAKGRRLFLCTDDPKDPFIARFGRFGARLFHDTPLCDMRFMLSFKKIIVSCSTYSWWAGFLSGAPEIYFPRPAFGRWSPMRSEIDLVVTDEDRYRYLDVRDAYRGNLRERIYNIRWLLHAMRRSLNRMRRARKQGPGA